MKIDRANTDDDQEGPENIDAITEPFGVRGEEKDHHRWHQKEEDIGHLNRRKHFSCSTQLGNVHMRNPNPLVILECMQQAEE